MLLLLQFATQKLKLAHGKKKLQVCVELIELSVAYEHRSCDMAPLFRQDELLQSRAAHERDTRVLNAGTDEDL